MLFTTLGVPGIELVKAHPAVLALKDWVKARLASSSGEDGKPNANADGVDDQADDNDIRQETLAMCYGVQRTLVGVLHSLLMSCVFGPVVPGLLCLVPFAVVTILCALSWVQSEPTKDKNSLGQLLAANVMVQSPASIVAQLGVPLSWLICGFTMWDLEFSNGAMIFYSVLSVGTLGALVVQSKSDQMLGDARPKGLERANELPRSDAPSSGMEETWTRSNCVRVALDVDPNTTVSDLHLQLAERARAPTEAMCLVFGDVELDPNRTLNDYLDRSGQTLQLVPMAIERSGQLGCVEQDLDDESPDVSNAKVEKNPLTVINI